jgi:hypothetical protein
MSGDRGRWTPEECEREERARAARAEEDQKKGPEERLEDMLRVSRLIAELQQGATRDAPNL